MVPEEISTNQALDRLVTAFDARGWRDAGDTAAGIARAAAGSGHVNAAELAASAQPTFLASNGVTRSALAAAIKAALGSVVVVSPGASSLGGTHINVSNTGTMIGAFGGGAVSGVQIYQQQVIGDDAIRALVGEYQERTDVREIVESELPPEEKRSRLTTVVQGLGSFASDTLAKIVTHLLTHS